MGTTKPQLFAIQNEDTPAPDSGGDGPPSGEHEAGAHATVVTGPPVEVEGTDPRERPTKEVPAEEAPERPGGFMRDISKPQRSNLTDANHKNGVPRWEIAKLTEAEWRRALAHNDKEIAETTPGSEEFARLMESRHRMAFPPPKNVKYDDISRYHADVMRKELEERMPKGPRFDRRWILLGIGFLALITVTVIVVVPALREAPTPAPTGAAPTQEPAATEPPGPTTAPAPEKTVAPAPTQEPAVAVTAEPVGTGRSPAPQQKSSAPVTTQAPTATASPPTPATAAPTNSNTPYFLPKSKSP